MRLVRSIVDDHSVGNDLEAARNNRGRAGMQAARQIPWQMVESRWRPPNRTGCAGNSGVKVDQRFGPLKSSSCAVRGISPFVGCGRRIASSQKGMGRLDGGQSRAKNFRQAGRSSADVYGHGRIDRGMIGLYLSTHPLAA